MPPEFWRTGTLCALAAVGLFGGLGAWAATVAAGAAAALHALAWRRARKRRRRHAATELPRAAGRRESLPAEARISAAAGSRASSR